MALAAPLAACLRAADARFLALSASPALLQPLDAFLERAARAQTQREGRPPSLSTDARAVLLLFLRAATLLPPPESASSERLELLDTLLHATRVAPLCQVFAPTNAAAIARLLELLAPHGVRFGVQQLQRVFRSHLVALHETVQQDKRTQVVDAIHSVYEVALSLRGLLAADAFAPLLLLEHGDADVELAFRSETLVRALVVAYEADLPKLQRHLATLDDDKAQEKVLVIAETRHLLLQVLARFLDLLLGARSSDGHQDDEVLLEVLHTMSHCCDDDDADQGSYLSDLWYLCDYKDKISNFLEAGETGSEHLSYLEMIVDALPRRRVVTKADADASKRPTAARSPPDAKTPLVNNVPAAEVEITGASHAPAATTPTSTLVAQVLDFFPDLGDGYVELCLLSVQHELETVVNFLLENNPPPALLGVRPSLRRSDPEFAVVEAQLTGKPSPAAAGTTTAPSLNETKLDPSRVWVGKKPQEKTYDPQVGKRDRVVADKTKKMALQMEEEEQLLAGVAPVAQLDEYDDDYNDEFEDYEPFGVHDSGQGDTDQDRVRLENRLVRAREAEDAFWESMRNVNRLQPATNGAPIDEDEEKRQLPNAVRAGFARPDATGVSSKGGASGGLRKKGGQPKQQPPGGTKKNGPYGAKGTGGAGASAGASAEAPFAASDAPAVLTKEQELRARARSAKNKAKVGNHHRKDRALKKQG